MSRTKITLADGSVIRVETRGGCSSGCGATFTVIVVIFVAIGPGYWAATGVWPIWGAVLAYLVVALVIVAALTNAVQKRRQSHSSAGTGRRVTRGGSAGATHGSAASSAARGVDGLPVKVR